MKESRGAVVVTGASSGIGEACALRLDRLGFTVFAGVRKDSDAQALRLKASDRLAPVMLDVTKAPAVHSAADTVTKAVGDRGLAGLVNNAGIAVGGPLEFTPLEDLRRQLEVNLVGQVAVTQAFLPLIRQGRGRIVNIGSFSGMVAFPFAGPYAASKFALEAITDAWRLELRPWGVKVSIIQAGEIETPIWEKSMAAADAGLAGLPPQGKGWYGEVIKAIRDRLAKHQGLPPDRVAELVVHALNAARPRSRYVIGRGAWRVRLLRVLPERIRDWLIASQLPGYR